MHVFELSNLLLVIFFDGSLPKRSITSIDLNNENLEITINTSENMFSTMDYRKHTFVVKVTQEYFKNIIIKK